MEFVYKLDNLMNDYILDIGVEDNLIYVNIGNMYNINFYMFDILKEKLE